MSDQQQEPLYLRTVADFVALPADKIAHCVKDFELWLLAIKIAEGNSQRITTPTDAFGWIDDGKHHVKVEVNGLDVASLRDNHRMEVNEVADAIVDRLVERLSGKRRKGARS